MKKNKYAKRYAKMFLNAVGLDAAPEALKELITVNTLMDKSPEFKGLLVSPQFTKEEKKSALKQVGQTLNLSENTVKFISYLSDVSAASALGEVIDKAIAIYSEKKRKVKATVITPVEIDKQYEDRLKESLKRLTERDVDIEYATDPSLLGGMLVKVGSTMYDGSIKGQLRLLRDELIKG
jgi:ATP synthase F1 delta subunit